MNAASPVSLADVSHRPTGRHTTGLDGINWVYGSSPMAGGQQIWGLPVGGVSLWAGAAGSGKSRLAIAVVASMSLDGRRVLIAQNEVSPTQLASWFAGKAHDASRIHVLDSPNLDSLLDAMWASDYSLVIIDSISMLHGVERQSQARRIIAELRNAVAALSSHVVMISHLNAQGKVRGGTTLTHLVDTVATLERGEIDGWVQFGIDGKHRYGQTGRSVTLHHDDVG